MRTVIKHNLLTRKGYTPYCGGNYICITMPRTEFDGQQFVCPDCGWVSEFPTEFISAYKAKWATKPVGRKGVEGEPHYQPH